MILIRYLKLYPNLKKFKRNFILKENYETMNEYPEFEQN